MPRGDKYPIGHERIAQNGYHYIKVAPSEWKLKHHIIAEEKIGRPIDSKVERVVFLDHDRHNFDPENIAVECKKGIDMKDRKARLEARILELQTELTELSEEEPEQEAV